MGKKEGDGNGVVEEEEEGVGKSESGVEDGKSGA